MMAESGGDVVCVCRAPAGIVLVCVPGALEVTTTEVVQLLCAGIVDMTIPIESNEIPSDVPPGVALTWLSGQLVVAFVGSAITTPLGNVSPTPANNSGVVLALLSVRVKVLTPFAVMLAGEKLNATVGGIGATTVRSVLMALVLLPAVV